MSETNTTHMTPQAFTEALRVLGWTQRGFADRVGIHPQTVNRWATGYEGADIPKWAAAYLGAMLDLAMLRDKYLAPVKHGKAEKIPPSLGAD